jgi:ElaB/YqjD/DUF883 family membrane-anchored ribosome-binding protein
MQMEENMAPQDAEMPSHQALSEDIAQIRRDIDNLTSSIKRAGDHQAKRVQDKAHEGLSALENAVKRDPVTTLGWALGAGFLLGILLRR